MCHGGYCLFTWGLVVRICLHVPWWLVLIYMGPGSHHLFSCGLVDSVCLHEAHWSVFVDIGPCGQCLLT